MKKLQGFTLIELMMVVAIIGIIASVAVPSYQDSIIKSRRGDAKGALMGFSNAMERYFTENNTYCDAGGAGGTSGCGTATNDTGTPSIYSATSPLDGATAFYNLTIATADATSYNLRATPVTGGPQDGDGILEINQTESRGRWDRNNDGDTADAGENTWD